MNIMVFIPNLDYGGVSNYSIKCVEMLKEDYDNVYLVSFNNSRNFECCELHLIKGMRLINKIYNLRKFIKERKINKVITSIDLAPIITKISCLGIEVEIFSVFHMRPNLYKINSNLKLKNKIFDFLLSLGFVVSKNIITVSKGLEKEVKEEYYQYNKKIITIYNPIIKEIDYKEIDYIDIENKSEVNILNVGWIYDLKNQLEILEAIKLLENHKLKLTIVGGIKDRAYYEKLLEFITKNNLKNIEFVGTVEDVKEYFKKADIFISASKSETLSNVLIEALENKVPIISKNCKYGPEEVLCCGEYGVLYSGRATELKEKVEYILNNDVYNGLKNNSIDRAKSFTYKEIKSKYINVLTY